MAERPRLSVVITSYTTDRIKDIIELLDAIGAQSYRQLEIMFVAESSRQLYEQIVAYRRRNHAPGMTVLFNEGEPGLSAARNLGIEHAKGDIIAFIDDDALPFPDWADKIVEVYQDDSVIGVTGPILPLWEDGSMDWFPKELDWILVVPISLA